MKRNYNGVSKGKVIPLTEVKPGMVFRMARNGRAVHSLSSGVLTLGVYVQIVALGFLLWVYMGLTITIG